MIVGPVLFSNVQSAHLEGGTGRAVECVRRGASLYTGSKAGQDIDAWRRVHEQDRVVNGVMSVGSGIQAVIGSPLVGINNRTRKAAVLNQRE